MGDYVQANRAIWNGWTTHHLTSAHHQDVATFRAGGLTLRGIERAEVGEVAGKSLLHLQCNMGSDTLSWARLGARVTGVDFADAAIEQARALAAEAGIADARFLHSDLYALPETLDERFDIVFTSYGALCWLPDLPRWAEIAARYVRPGGVFYIVDMHPFTNACAFAGDTAEDGDTAALRCRVSGRYAHAPEPLTEVARDAGTDGATVYLWSYGLGEVISALLAAGLRLEHVHEFPVTFYQRYPMLTRGADGWWRWPAPENTLPLLFSIRATKPAGG